MRMYMDRSLLKQVILEQEKTRKLDQIGTKRLRLVDVESLVSLAHVVVVAGIRRCGKSTLLRQIINEFYTKAQTQNFYYIDFEDERLLDFDVQDFNGLYEVLIELYGLKNVFFFDEVQNIPEWEVYVRRMHREKNKLFITGSNASLLSSELGTKLTGRHVVIELLPFSFQEFLHFHGISWNQNSFLMTQEKALLKRSFNEYLEYGGMPEYLEHKNPTVLHSVYDNILYKDIIVRYQIKAVKALRELALYLMSNVGALISYSNLKNMLQLGSVNTVKDFIHYLENAFLIFTVDKFSFSVGEQTTAQKKVYAVDTGLIRQIAFRFSQNRGKYLENVVYLELRRRYKDIFYYRTKGNLEVDFLVRKGLQIDLLIQVSESLSDLKTRERELTALNLAMKELKHTSAFIITLDEEEFISMEFGRVEVISIYKWLLQDQ